MIDPNQKHEDKDWQLDAMLDSLLRSYSAAEPRPGFETRLRAVVGEQAARTRRTSWLMIAASAAALVLFAWTLIANPHKSRTRVAGSAVAQNLTTADSGQKVVSHVTSPAKNQRTLQPTANRRSDKTNQIVLQMVASTEGNRSLVFEHEKLYLTPETPAETETTAEAAPSSSQTEDGQAPAVSIKSIGVASIESNAPIEIKDLAPPKKGSL